MAHGAITLHRPVPRNLACVPNPLLFKERRHGMDNDLHVCELLVAAAAQLARAVASASRTAGTTRRPRHAHAGWAWPGGVAHPAQRPAGARAARGRRRAPALN